MTPGDVLVEIVDRATASAVARSGTWLQCKPGCSQCCHGVFAISPLDAERLRAGLDTLAITDPARAAQVKRRSSEAVACLSGSFPGDPATGWLSESLEAEAAFENFANDEPCPALNPETQTCDLYQARPLLCRTFGPPMLTPEDGLAACELCFDGATTADIERALIDPAILDAEQHADEAHAAATGEHFRTIIAFALVRTSGDV